jgi:hypothetical protein
MIACCLNCKHYSGVLVPYCTYHDDNTTPDDHCEDWQSNQGVKP